MFTGIIEEIGTISSVKKSGNFASLEISCVNITDDCKTGDSVSVNGVCLTVTDITESAIRADISYETLKKSSLKYCNAGSFVNLERALKLSQRLGGHIVSGHVDCTGMIKNISKMDDAFSVNFSFPENFGQYIVSKGSISIDGISLTTSTVYEDNTAEIAVIPHTFKSTTLKHRKSGDVVNIEVDIIVRYLEKLLKKVEKKDKLHENILKMQQMEEFS